MDFGDLIAYRDFITAGTRYGAVVGLSSDGVIVHRSDLGLEEYVQPCQQPRVVVAHADVETPVLDELAATMAIRQFRETQ